MSGDRNQIISAQLVIRSASGKSTKGEAVTTANIADFLPSAEVASRVLSLLSKLGFQVGNVVGNSVSITAPVRTFEKVFKVRVGKTRKGAIVGIPKGGRAGRSELPLSVLPKEVRELVEAVTFTPPPDFGPTSW
jgi:hypothetical protein